MAQSGEDPKLHGAAVVTLEVLKERRRRELEEQQARARVLQASEPPPLIDRARQDREAKARRTRFHAATVQVAATRPQSRSDMLSGVLGAHAEIKRRHLMGRGRCGIPFAADEAGADDYPATPFPIAEGEIVYGERGR